MDTQTAFYSAIVVIVLFSAVGAYNFVRTCIILFTGKKYNDGYPFPDKEFFDLLNHSAPVNLSYADLLTIVNMICDIQQECRQHRWFRFFRYPYKELFKQQNKVHNLCIDVLKSLEFNYQEQSGKVPYIQEQGRHNRRAVG